MASLSFPTQGSGSLGEGRRGKRRTPASSSGAVSSPVHQVLCEHAEAVHEKHHGGTAQAATRVAWTRD